MSERMIEKPLSEQAAAIEQLTHQPGWQLFQEIMVQSEQTALQQMISAKSSDETMFYKGVYKATRDLRTWAERSLMVYMSQQMEGVGNIP